MMDKIIWQLQKCPLCLGMARRLGQEAWMKHSVRQFSSTSVLQRKKMSRKYNPRMRSFSEYGATSRNVRGLDTDLSRYGPLVDKPDYTFLDGRPTPLTPEQMEERQTRKDMAETVIQYMNEMKEVKSYVTNVKPKLVADERKKILESKLKAKS